LGITGRDQVAEYEALGGHADNEAEVNGIDGKVNGQGTRVKGDGRNGGEKGVEEVMDLGFGKCKLQVQVPEKGEFQNARQLIGKNVVTSFTGLSELYFGRLEGVEKEGNGATGPKLQTKIKYVGGSVEAACALGVADGIVDLVESGETMKAAGLKAVDTVVESTAVLIKSKKTSNDKLVDLIAARIKGVISKSHDMIPRNCQTANRFLYLLYHR